MIFRIFFLGAFSLAIAAPEALAGSPGGKVIEPLGPRVITSETLEAVASFIRAAGYDCETVNATNPSSGGFTAYCNGYRYSFQLENHGGRWAVKAK